MLRRGGRIAGCALALALGTGAARAGDQTQALGSTGLQARVRSAWPKGLTQGWAPIRLELRNDSARTREVRLEATSWDWNSERSFEARLTLDPGQVSELELLMPMGAVNQNQYWLQVHHGEEMAYFGDCLGTSTLMAGMHPVLLVSERVPEAGELEALAATLGAAIPSATASSMASIGYTSVSGAAHDVEIAHARHEDLARQWGAYTSLDLVVLDADHGLPAAEKLAPLMAWVRSGGELLVIGTRARAEAERAPELAAWMEPRFQRANPLGDEYRCGLGRLTLSGVGAELGDLRPFVRELLDARTLPVPDGGAPWRASGAFPQIPGLDRLPFRTFALILVLFAVLIGPVNFFLVARRRRAVLLLVTIPAISLVTTLLLVGYGVLFQGLDVKTSSISIALLDERAHRSSSPEVRQLFAGLAPGEGLIPGSGTLVSPLSLDSERQRFELELAERLLLKGDFLPSRTPVHQVLNSERAERARLGVARIGERLRVDNNLGVELLELAVRAPDGRLYASVEPLRPGESVELAPAGSALNAEALVESLHSRAMALAPRAPESPTEFLPPGCYVAALRASPFRDACGIELNELSGTHVVLGVLPLGEEAWR